MIDAWYELVEASNRLTQGDFILNCPISTWAEETNEARAAPEAVESPGHWALPEVLLRQREIISEDVIVMTQACDLEHGKVTDVVLCPHYALSYYREEVWRPDQTRKAQKTNSETWQKYYKGIANGHLWNLCILNSSSIGGRIMEHRVVDFHVIYTVPRGFLERLLADRREPRLRLLPPYREHLSQAFARYFMRVGLPSPLAQPQT